MPATCSGTRRILHLTSANLWDWQFQSALELSSERVIDACVYPLPGDGWCMWYKDEANGSFTYAADSPNLEHWTRQAVILADKGARR